MSQKAADALNSAKAMFDLQIVATSLTAGMAFALALTGGLTLDMYDRIAAGGFKDPQEENQDYADKTVGMANASYYIGVLVFYALSILLGYQGGKGKDALGQKSSKIANGFCQGFSFIAFILLFATCGMGIKMFDSVESWSAKKECTTTTTAVAATVSAPMMRAPKNNSKKKSRATTTTTTEAEDADKSERKAVSIYNTYIAFLVIFSLLFGVYIWYIVKYSSYSGTISKYTSQASQYATNKYQAYKGSSAAAAPAAAAIQGGRGYGPAVSEFFTY